MPLRYYQPSLMGRKYQVNRLSDLPNVGRKSWVHRTVGTVGELWYLLPFAESFCLPSELALERRISDSRRPCLWRDVQIVRRHISSTVVEKMCTSSVGRIFNRVKVREWTGHDGFSSSLPWLCHCDDLPWHDKVNEFLMLMNDESSSVWKP